MSSLDTFPAHVLEDYAIARDAGYVPGYSLIAHDLTGHAVFKRGMERLDIYIANKGPLETMLGVDLIYFNESVGNIVMLQYKMLEPHRNPDLGGTDWIYRPDDQFDSELARMRLPPLDGERADYRLHPSPFFNSDPGDLLAMTIANLRLSLLMMEGRTTMPTFLAT